ncbi:hypothetical protein DAI22_11g207900 [Oryza sativa Japonica Group]|nr:hypothetical protein DAI22_11g207900 [Oryza sativa Japonica Group]
MEVVRRRQRWPCPSILLAASSLHRAGSGRLDVGGCWIRPPGGGIDSDLMVNLQFL